MTQFLTIRKVTNGWIVHLGTDPALQGHASVDDTLVFETIDALVAGIQTIYSEELDNDN